MALLYSLEAECEYVAFKGTMEHFTTLALLQSHFRVLRALLCASVLFYRTVPI